MTPAKILVVDDTPQNLKLLGDLLSVKGYSVSTAANGEEALAKVAAEKPDLVLLDVMMPGISGYEVCKRIRANPETALLPVVLCTSLDPKQERINGIEAGADDFIPKPINQAELFARVKSLLRIKTLQDEVKAQAAQLAEWNLKLEDRVREQVAQMDRLGRLKNFFSPQLAEAIVAGGSTFRDYRDADGGIGSFQERFQVYEREGLPCVRCGEELLGKRIGGRSTVYCRRCQR